MSETHSKHTVPLTILCLIVAPVALPSLAEATAEPLAWFHPGTPGEPAWTILKLDVPATGLQLRVQKQFIEPRCPMDWGFLVFSGSPENASSYSGLVHGSVSGRGGAEIYVGNAEPLSQDAGASHREGDDRCYLGNIGAMLGLPKGVAYLLEYTAGAPFKGTAVVTATSEAVTLVGKATGNTSYYIEGANFGPAGTHASAYTPRAEAMPVTYLSGGIVAAEASLGRTTRLSFDHHPHYIFAATNSVNNASVTDPTGRSSHARGVISSQGWGIGGGHLSSLTRYTSDLPPGEYVFDVEAAITAGTPWHVSGVDFRFPEEAG